MLFLTLGWVLYLVLNGYSLILLSGQELWVFQPSAHSAMSARSHWPQGFLFL